MNYDTVPTICAAIVAVFAIQGITIYSVVKAAVLGRSLAERRDRDPGADRDGGRILSPRSW